MGNVVLPQDSNHRLETTIKRPFGNTVEILSVKVVGGPRLPFWLSYSRFRAGGGLSGNFCR